MRKKITEPVKAICSTTSTPSKFWMLGFPDMTEWGGGMPNLSKKRQLPILRSAAFWPFRSTTTPPEAGSCSTGPGNRAGVSLMQQWALFWFCVLLDALVLYALMAAAERWAR